MNLQQKKLWHLDPLTGVPMDKTVADFKYTYIMLLYNIYCNSLRRLFDRICTDQRKRPPILWKEWDLNPEKVCSYMFIWPYI